MLGSTLLALLVLLGLGAAGLDASFRDLARRALRETLDAQLLALMTAAETDGSGRVAAVSTLADPRLQTPASGLYAEIRTADGIAIWRSPSMVGAGAPSQLDAAVARPGDPAEYRESSATGTPRLATLARSIRWQIDAGAAQDLVFAVSTSLDPYETQLRRFRTQLFSGLSVMSAAVLLLISLLLRRALAPLDRLEREIAAVRGGSAAALGDGYPRELAGVTTSLNALLASEQSRLQRYRDTLGDLAHSLKTPLAVMRGALAAPASATRSELEQQLTRMTDIVDRGLRRAVPSGAVGLGGAAVAVQPVAAELRLAMLRAHGQRDFSIEIAVPDTAAFAGERADLLEALGNLMDNACKWCRGTVRVAAVPDIAAPSGTRSSSAVGRWLAVRVEDDGPGWPPDWLHGQPVRGRRADERVPGHGIGLAMVADMARLYGGELRLERGATGGAIATLVLPSA